MVGMSTEKTKRTPMLILTSGPTIALGAWLVSVGISVIAHELMLGIGAVGGGLLLVGSGVVALVAGSWTPLKDILHMLVYP